MKPILHSFWLLLLAGLVNVALAQGQSNVIGGDDDEDDDEDEVATAPSRPLNPNATQAHIVINGDVWTLVPDQELTLQRERLYDVAIYDLKPNSRVFIDFRKAGVSVGTRGFNANRNGEFMFEYTTPNSRARGEAIVKYTAANGREVTLTLKVRLE